jgi:hypothetical protein
MALADPQSVTISGTANALPRTGIDRTSADYTSADGALKFSVSHQYGRRNRSIVRIDTNKISPDPLTDVKQKLSASVYLLVDRPSVGFSASELSAVATGLTTWLAASSGANLTKVLGGES